MDRMSPEYSRTAAIAVNMPGLSLEERPRLRAALIAAGTYRRLDEWAAEKYSAAHVIYEQRFGPAAPSADTPPRTPEEKEASRRFARFFVRAEDLIWASCVSCERKSRGSVCDAYPDGIPEVILNGQVDHKTPHPGDGGLTYLAAAPQPEER